MKATTIYLSIPKEKARDIICKKVDDVYATSIESKDLIGIRTSQHEYDVAALHDHNLKTERIETASLEVETGSRGTRMEYRSSGGGLGSVVDPVQSSHRKTVAKKRANQAKEAVSEYIVGHGGTRTV
ncbi:MAG: hypothetical protein ABEJ60_05190 [Halodesulfurarchaeum sp.]